MSRRQRQINPIRVARRVTYTDPAGRIAGARPSASGAKKRAAWCMIAASYFPAQNWERRVCDLNRSVCGKLQDRTDLKLTPVIAADSFL
jgi:hypothetical protein